MFSRASIRRLIHTKLQNLCTVISYTMVRRIVGHKWDKCWLAKSADKSRRDADQVGVLISIPMICRTTQEQVRC